LEKTSLLLFYRHLEKKTEEIEKGETADFIIEFNKEFKEVASHTIFREEEEKM
jgi:hypothetical protein